MRNSPDDPGNSELSGPPAPPPGVAAQDATICPEMTAARDVVFVAITLYSAAPAALWGGVARKR
jgi:hypothetical protein